MQTRTAILAYGAVSMALALAGAVVARPASAAETVESAGSVLWQPSMNVFRRFAVPEKAMFDFYGTVLGFEQLDTLNVGAGTGVARFQAGGSELKLTARIADRAYVSGGVDDATGLRLLSFFFPDERALIERFEAHGLAPPVFAPRGSGSKSALVTDPDGQAVELVVIPGAAASVYRDIEIGLTVADLETSRAFYADFVGLEALPPEHDPVFNTTKHAFRHGTTIVSLRSFGPDLPADTGSGGIQYVVSNVDHVDTLAKKRLVTIDQPLTGLAGFRLRTIWLDDPDGITNYFAETAQSREGAHP